MDHGSGRTVEIVLFAVDFTADEAVAEARRDAFEDDRSQGAVERLNTMADALSERADASLNQERKTNTSRRARFASSAEASARADKALAGTMSNLAQAIESGKAKFLDAVRQKVQVEFLASELRSAKDAQIRAKYPSYGDQEKRRGEPVDAETVDHAAFPAYTAFRSDLASIARQMLEVDGTKKLGAQLMRVADDVTEAYTDFAKANLQQVSRFSRGEQMADFKSRDDAERALRRSGLTGRAIVLAIKRGENRVVLSPSEAQKLGIWSGDGDKRITLTGDFGREMVEALGRRAKGQIKLPWQLESAYNKRKRLESMGITTPSEFRAALREFAGIQEVMATPDKIKQMERAMIGRANDGLDFFPTSEVVVDSMLDAAEIEDGMSVLEPSAGMGHIADAIRDKAGVDPDVIELSGDRRELLEAKGHHLVGRDFLEMTPRGFTFGDVFRAPDGTEGVLRGSAGLGSGRVGLDDANGVRQGYYNRDELVEVRKQGHNSGYDRIVMNPPFSKGRDIEHVQHAYSLLRPGGRVVAIMGEGAFFQSNKAAENFRAWLDDLGATSEKLPEASFMDSSLPVNTGVNARMVVIDKPQSTALYSLSDKAYSDAGLSPSSAVVGKVPESPISVGEATAAADQFLADYNGNIELTYRIRKTQDELYGPAGSVEKIGIVKGAYHPGRGLFTLTADHLSSAVDAHETLRHEILGHFGLDTFKPADKQAFLDKILASKDEPSLKAVWDEIAVRYSDKSQNVQAEEVFARLAEVERSVSEKAIDFLRAAITRLLRAVGVKKVAITRRELLREAEVISRGIRNGSRKRQNFDSETLFRREPASALYRLNNQPAKGIPLFSAKAIAKKLNDKLGLSVKVAATEADLPAELQAQIKRDGASGKVGGVFHNGQSYIIASNLTDTKHAVRLVLHEAIGHGGVQAVLGAKLGNVMRSIYRDMPAAMRRELETRYGSKLDGLSQTEREQEVAEEYVAHIAEYDPQNSLLERIVSLIRTFIRDTFGDQATLKWSRNDIIQLLAEAKRAARNDLPPGGNRYRNTAEQDEAPALMEVSETDEAEFVASLKSPAAVTSIAGAMYKAKGTESPFFQRWFAKSKMVDRSGAPVAFVHRSFGDMSNFDDARLGSSTGTATAALGHFLARKDVGNVERYGPVTDQFFIRMEKPKVITQAQFEAMGDWSVEQVQQYRAAAMKAGHDGLYIQGLGWPVVFEGKNIKGKRNTGTFDATANTRYSLNPTADAFGKLGLGEKEAETLAEKIRAVAEQDWRKTLKDLKARANEGLIDGLAGIYNAEKSLGIATEKMGYLSARMATGLADHMKALMNYGALEWRDGVVQQKADTRGLLDVLSDVGNEDMAAWLGWLGGKRAELLKRQGKENNLTDADIAELLSVGDKAAKFEKAYQEYAKLNNAILDLAEGAGLIDPKARAGWMTDYYVPFYRQEEGENQFTGPSSKKGLSHQTAAIKALKGGTMPTKDLLENILTAWTKRVDASIKNKALNDIVANLGGTEFMTEESMKWQRQVISRAELVRMIKGDRNYLEYWAEQLGLDETANHLQVAHALNKLSTEGYEEHWAQVAPTDPAVIRVMIAGKAKYYRVNEPSLLRGLVAMAGNSFNDPVTKAGRWFKRVLTTGITASPDFMARNFLRDAVHAWVINPDGYKLGIDSVKGLRAAFKEDPHYQELIFAGGAFQGGYIMGNDPEAAAIAIRRALASRGLTSKQQADYMAGLLLSPAQMGSALKKGWEHYREAGDKIENANRLATYKAARAAGKSVRLAAYESKDLMDYSMRGNFAAMVWLTDMVPFLNARLQGLGKLGRAMKGDKTLLAKHVAMKGAYIALFSLLLAGMNDDDDRYKQLEDWDKDANWHFWFSADQVEPYRIPKPFELGLIFGTIPERMFHLGAGSQGKEDFGRAMVHGLTSTLAFNPIPQFYTPIRDVQANRDFFRNSPIEGMADEGKLSAARYDSRTSETARLLGEYTGPAMGLSPKQLQYLWKGYTGTMGGYVLSMADKVAEQMMEGTGESLPVSAADVPVLQAFYKGENPKGTRYQTEFYDMLEEATQISRTVKAMRAEGRTADSDELRNDNRDKINATRALGLARQQLGANHAKAESVRNSKTLSGERKQSELNQLQLQANAISKRMVDKFGERF
ncbi:MAG: hypothetical protein K2Y25_00735 [Pseudomonadaceae bacterium]|nr:hypothetical protein [Pseudomonadaceae bacterium]